MNTPVYFKCGAYPYESTLGILLNVASIYETSARDAFKYMSGRGMKFPGDLLYLERVPDNFPVNRIHKLTEHVPSVYHLSGFSVKEQRMRFCPDCLLVGYHSVFFCLPQVSKCLVHGRELQAACDSCQNRLSSEETSFKPCNICGFHWVCAVDQLFFRADGQLNRRLNRVGGQQRAWFEFVVSRARTGQKFFIMLDGVTNYSTTPSLHSIVTRFKLYPYEAHAEKVGGVLHCIRWKFSTEADSDIGWLAACEHLVDTHLGYHEFCLNRFNSYLRCWDGNALSEVHCLLSLGYFLVRLRLSSLSLHHGRASRLDDLSFKYVRALEQSFIGLNFVPSELARVYFLKLIFHLYAYLRAGYVVHIAMRPWGGVFYDLVARSTIVGNEGETFLSIVPLTHRSCENALSGERGLQSEQYRLRRMEENHFTISRADILGGEVVSVFL